MLADLHGLFLRQRARFPRELQPRAVVLVRLALHGDAAPFEAGDDMEVDMGHGLAGVGAVVLQDVDRFGPGDLLEGPHDAGQDLAHRRGVLVGQGVDGLGRLLGDHQGVALAQRVDVEDGDDMVVLIDFVGRDFAADDF